MFNRYSIALGLVVLMTLPADAMLSSPRVFGEKYKPVAPVVEQLTQVVYYRAKSGHVSKNPANLYIDGRYHTSLLAGGFTSFCLKPGRHTLGAFVNDPGYRGKSEKPFAAELQPGQTYFMRVDEQQLIGEPPVAVHRKQGESEMQQAKRQVHAYSRALTIVPCVFDHAAAQPQSHYLFSSRTLFTQQSGIQAVSDYGIEALNDMVVTLRQQNPLLRSVVIGIKQRGETRGEMTSKAQAIKTALSLAAIPSALISSQFLPCDSQCSVNDTDIQISVK